MNVFYKIWVDCILYFKSRSEKNTWKFYSILSMSMAMAINIALLMSIIQRNILKEYFYGIQINLFSSEKTNAFFNFFLYFFLPPLIINYFLIFWNRNYEKRILKYKFCNGKLFAFYFITSLFLPLALIVLDYLIMKI